MPMVDSANSLLLPDDVACRGFWKSLRACHDAHTVWEAVSDAARGDTYRRNRETPQGRP